MVPPGPVMTIQGVGTELAPAVRATGAGGLSLTRTAMPVTAGTAARATVVTARLVTVATAQPATGATATRHTGATTSPARTRSPGGSAAGCVTTVRAVRP